MDEQLIDQITEKCSSLDLKKKILAITLNMIIAEANSLETIERQLSGFTEPQTSSQGNVNAVLYAEGKKCWPGKEVHTLWQRWKGWEKSRLPSHRR
nr:unnamed protein product [Callosobruchus analis]